MRLTVVGCAGSFPGPDSPASCYLLEAGGFHVLLDLGNGALGALQRYADIYAIDAVLLSHLHPDHCLDLCGYYVARTYRPEGPAPVLPVYGPAATAGRLADAYGGGREPGLTDRFEFRTLRDGTPYDVGPMRVIPRRVDHPGEAFGFRIEHDGAALAYSGDTGPCDALVELARDADLFACEAAFHEGRDDGVTGVHLTGRGAGEHAARARARRLVLTHLPSWNDPARALAEARSAYDGPIELARTGATYDVGRH
ncbi:MAG: MBL fold metallo-hydrolase [Actinomycetota bacterium]|nr:MBL fold metallo-hydrolase [Actinomycetota bacterium]